MASITPKSGASASKKYVTTTSHTYCNIVHDLLTQSINRILLPTLAWLGAAYAVGLYVSKQLGHESGNLDRIFSQQNTAEVEEARRRQLLVDTYGDPRNTLLNVLGWTK
jgi:hypothetical protein